MEEKGRAWKSELLNLNYDLGQRTSSLTRPLTTRTFSWRCGLGGDDAPPCAPFLMEEKGRAWKSELLYIYIYM